MLQKTTLSIQEKIKNTTTYSHLRVNLFRRPIKVWFFREPDFKNFGDEIIIDIIERIFKKQHIRVGIEEAELFAVGSIMGVVNSKKKNKKSYVWGSGFIEEGGSITNKNLIFKAIRGCYSLNRLPKRYRNIAVGDPGLLSNLMYKNIGKKTDAIGIIPHYVDDQDELLEKAKKDDRYKIISVKDTPEVVAKHISECKVILSSSLHGLIVADSFGVPNAHMPMSNKVVGGSYKFVDYHSSIGRKHVKFDRKNLYKENEINKIIKTYRPIDNLESIQEELIKVFPF